MTLDFSVATMGARKQRRKCLNDSEVTSVHLTSLYSDYQPRVRVRVK